MGVLLEADEVKECPVGRELDEEVDVALGRVVAPRDGAEDTNVANPMPLRRLFEPSSRSRKESTATRGSPMGSRALRSRLRPEDEGAPARGEESLKGRKRWRRGAGFVPRDRWLRSLGARREPGLGEPSVLPRVADQSSDLHARGIYLNRYSAGPLRRIAFSGTVARWLSVTPLAANSRRH